MMSKFSWVFPSAIHYRFLQHAIACCAALLLFACSDRDACDLLGGCIADASLVISRPEIVWQRAQQYWQPREQKLGPGDTVPVRILVENHADTASLPAQLVLHSPLFADVRPLPVIPPKQRHVVELEYVVPAMTFRSADTLAVTVRTEHGEPLTESVVEGTTVVPLFGRGYEVRLVQLPTEVRTGVAAAGRVRIVNTFPAPLAPDSIVGCIWHVDYCPAFLATTPTYAIQPGDSAEFTVDVTPPVFSFHYWYERLEGVHLVLCVSSIFGDPAQRRCVNAPLVVLPNFALTCTVEAVVTPPADIVDEGYNCTTLGEQQGSLYRFNAVAGQRYRAERLSGDGPGVAISDDDGVLFNEIRPVFEFTAPATGAYYLIIRHVGPTVVRLTPLG